MREIPGPVNLYHKMKIMKRSKIKKNFFSFKLRERYMKYKSIDNDQSLVQLATYCVLCSECFASINSVFTAILRFRDVPLHLPLRKQKYREVK